MAGPILEYYAEQNVLAQFSGKTTNEIWPQVYKYLATKIDPKEKLTWNYTSFKIAGDILI